MSYNFSKTLITLVITLFIINCGNIESGKKLKLAESSPIHDKWLELMHSLKLPENPAEPSEYLTNPHLQDEYKDLIGKISDRFNSKAFATRCSSIERFRKLEHFSSSHSKYDVYQFSYKLQKNFSGAPEQKTRHGLITIPKQSGKKYPLMAFAHQGDEGLELNMLIKNLKSLLNEYIVIAPAFPGEYIHELESPLFNPGLSLPWDNDADELLGMHDCIARDVYLNLEKHKNPELAQKLSVNIADEHFDEIEESLEFIRSHTLTYNGDIAHYPKSILAGASRGGLVASVALAKAGSVLSYINEQSPGLFLRLLLSKGSLDQKFIDYLRLAKHGNIQGLGHKYGPLPPLFSGIATVSSPATVTIGTFRIILEQIVKGNLKYTRAKQLPAIDKLEPLFSNYTNGGTLESAKLEIVSRDFSFIAPLMITGLKDWQDPMNKGGSFLFLHGKEDKVVPIEQTVAAHQIFQTMIKKDEIKSQTYSKNGLQIFHRIFSITEPSDSSPFHFDETFFNSHSYYNSKQFFESHQTKSMHGKNKHLVKKVMNNLTDKLSSADSNLLLENCSMFKQLTVNYIIKNGGFDNYSENLNSNVKLKLHSSDDELKLQEGQGPAEVLEKWGLMMKHH